MKNPKSTVKMYGDDVMYQFNKRSGGYRVYKCEVEHIGQAGSLYFGFVNEWKGRAVLVSLTDSEKDTWISVGIPETEIIKVGTHSSQRLIYLCTEHDYDYYWNPINKQVVKVREMEYRDGMIFASR